MKPDVTIKNSRSGNPDHKESQNEARFLSNQQATIIQQKDCLRHDRGIREAIDAIEV